MTKYNNIEQKCRETRGAAGAGRAVLVRDGAQEVKGPRGRVEGGHGRAHLPVSVCHTEFDGVDLRRFHAGVYGRRSAAARIAGAAGAHACQRPHTSICVWMCECACVRGRA